jgi:FkbM family methyltransferase
VGFYLATDGVYEGQILDFILRHLPAGGAFLDVGANIGCFTVPAARHLKDSGQVLALEAAPGVFPYLQENVRLNNLSNVKAVQCAVSHEEGAQAPFYQAPADHFGMGSLAPQFYAEPVFVATRTLDSLLAENGVARVDVIKVDVEGFEHGVFQGAENLLCGENPPVIIFEFCDWAEERAPNYQVGDAQRLLQSWGYNLRRLENDAARRPPLKEPLTEGFATIVARRDG